MAARCLAQGRRGKPRVAEEVRVGGKVTVINL